jgi:hypothetical protein
MLMAMALALALALALAWQFWQAASCEVQYCGRMFVVCKSMVMGKCWNSLLHFHVIVLAWTRTRITHNTKVRVGHQEDSCREGPPSNVKLPFCARCFIRHVIYYKFQLQNPNPQRTWHMAHAHAHGNENDDNRKRKREETKKLHAKTPPLRLYSQ